MNNISQDLVCILFGDCVVKEYEYTFVFEGEKYKADDCWTSRYGSTYCEYNGITYTNVSYESKFLKEYKTKGTGLLKIFLPFIILIIIYWGMLMLLSSIRLFGTKLLLEEDKKEKNEVKK